MAARSGHLALCMLALAVLLCARGGRASTHAGQQDMLLGQWLYTSTSWSRLRAPRR